MSMLYSLITPISQIALYRRIVVGMLYDICRGLCTGRGISILYYLLCDFVSSVSDFIIYLLSFIVILPSYHGMTAYPAPSVLGTT